MKVRVLGMVTITDGTSTHSQHIDTVVNNDDEAKKYIKVLEKCANGQMATVSVIILPECL